LPAIVLYCTVSFCLFREGDTMAVSYNRLWKLLIDKGMTKTEMRKAAGISTNVLAKMGKNETVSMDTLARIAAVMECGLDEIVEINCKEV
jgi:putative transcriptional regulator